MTRRPPSPETDRFGNEVVPDADLDADIPAEPTTPARTRAPQRNWRHRPNAFPGDPPREPRRGGRW